MFIALVFSLITASSSQFLQNILRSYDPLLKDSITIKQYSKHVIFSLRIGNESHVAVLTPNQHTFHKHFTADVIGDTGTKRLSDPTKDHLTGVLENYPDSWVSVHISDGIVTGSIQLHDEVYYIEPSWRHIPQSHPFHMILYKRSDVIFNLGHPETGHFCGHPDHHHSDHHHDLHPDHYGSFHVKSNESIPHSGEGIQYQRFKRSAVRNTCEVVLVADYKFYSEIGGNSELATKSYMIAIFERITQIFESSVFKTSSNTYTGYGMQVKKVIVHTSSSSNPTHYNYARDWDVSDLLDAFGYAEPPTLDWSKYCLAHLYTNRDFNLGVLGLAYVASPVSNKVGGMCSVPYTSGNGKMRMLNTGISTSKNYGRTLLSSELELVSAHEIGHNWGSSHDPDSTDECAPPDNRFLMYPSAVDGSRSNNKRFSPCSRSAIASVLKYKSGCFVAASDTICGNGVVEGEEDCDAGSEGKDACCTAECKFAEGAVCSDRNSECCKDCNFAGTSTICYKANVFDNSNACVAQKHCSPDSTTCSIVTYVADNTTCFDEGTCIAGKCLDFCAAKGLHLCQGTGNNSCYWTCAKSPTHPCDMVYSVLPDGKPCPNGACVAGTCILEPQTQTKIWTILTNLTASSFWGWVKNNVILVVILGTSIFWVPLSIFVAWLDKGYDEVDYYNYTLQRKKAALRAQMSTVSSRSFELKNLVEEEPPTHTFSLTGQHF